jgi:hypothetical protein
MMNWLSAKKLIAEKLVKGSDLNTPDSEYRVVREAHEGGFIVPIGQKTDLDIPWSMLEFCYFHLNTDEGYSKIAFVHKYKKQAKDHGCHVHVVGQIFVVAGLAEADGSRRYVAKAPAIRSSD